MPFPSLCNVQKTLLQMVLCCWLPQSQSSSFVWSSCPYSNRCLTPAEFAKFKELSKGGLKPSAILNVLHANKKEGESLLATKNTIYVAKRCVKMESLQGLSPIVHLKNQLGNSDYLTCVKTDNDGTLKALFFCHHASLELYSAYNTIIFANST